MRKSLTDHLCYRQAQLAKEIEVLERRYSSAPEEKSGISGTKGYAQYFRVDKSCKENDKGQDKYLKSEEFETAKALAQKECDRKDLLDAGKEKELIDSLVLFLKGKRRVYDLLISKRKALVTPVDYPDEEYVEKWQSEVYVKKGFPEGAQAYRTDRGELVRSKSELLVANALYHAGVPYKYERPIRLADGNVCHPDFTILNKRTGEEFLFEHFGIMDDPKYRDDFFNRIHMYSLNDVLAGVNLLVSFEGPSNGHGFDGIHMKHLIRECFV